MKPNRSQPDKLSRRYVDFDKGWRPFFIGVLIAAVLGIGFRLAFSPQRLKSWVATAIADQKRKIHSKFALAFETAELRLRKGWQPQFAVVLKGVKAAPAPECRPEPSLVIEELSLPLRLLPLIANRKFSVGVVSAEGMTIDLDGFKERCTQASHAEPVALAEKPKASFSENAGWWTEKQIADVKAVIEGVEFQQIEIQFEKKSKRLFLDSLRAELTKANSIDFATELRVPPETSYGEKIPSLLIEGVATAKRADVKISARVDEGEIEASAILTSQPDRALAIDAALGIGDLPLSTLVPLMRKVGLASDRFQPKFLWLNCSAKIKGTFQKVFDRNPLYLDNCSLEGDGSKLTLSQATRLPGGAWEPFTIRVEALDLGKFLKTIGAQGPDGISNQFGRVRGAIEIKSAKEAEFRGTLQSAELSFSSGRVRAQQGVDTADLAVNFDGEKFKGEIKNVMLRDGEARGRVDLDFERGLKRGRATATLERIVFSPEVQALLIHGNLGALSGKVESQIDEGKLSSLVSSLKFAASSGRDLRFESLALTLERLPQKSAALEWTTQGFALHANSRYFKALEPIFLTHKFEHDWIAFENLRLESEITQNGFLTWKKAHATVEKDQIAIGSSGVMSRERQLKGVIEVDYPKIRNLKWNLSGSTALPLLIEGSQSLKDLKERVELDDEALGLVER